MPIRLPVLLLGGELAPEYRWRLVHSLFAQRRSLLEGSLAFAAVLAVCLARTHWLGFATLLVATLLVLGLRIALERTFTRAMREPAGRLRHSADAWARRFSVGAMATAALWGITELCVFMRFNDPLMQMFVTMVQAAWLSAATVRNAAAPSTMAAQCILTLLPTVVGALLTHPGFVQIVAPLSLVQLSAAAATVRYTGKQITRLMLSEQRLETANARLTELSATDGLTGIGNRRAFDTVLQTEWARATRNATDLSLLVIDVDHFKSFNDRYGHPAGDECLRLIADVTQRPLRRPPDFAARFGGEEFVALLPGTSEAAARDVADRVRQAVVAAFVPHETNPMGCVTISIGVASMAPHPGDMAQTLIGLADQALYRAKQRGRNQVRTAGDDLAMRAWLAVRAGAIRPEG